MTGTLKHVGELQPGDIAAWPDSPTGQGERRVTTSVGPSPWSASMVNWQFDDYRNGQKVANFGFAQIAVCKVVVVPNLSTPMSMTDWIALVSMG